MKLVPVKAKAQAADQTIKYYRHPMDPSIHSKTPAKDSMGMDYIPVYEHGKGSEAAETQGAQVDGRASFNLTPEQLKLSGARIVAVERRSLTKELRVPGRALGGKGISFQVYEQDLSLIRKGMTFRAEAPMLSGERLSGQIASIESILDPMTRTARVNGVLRESGKQSLRTEASLSGTIEVKLQNVLVVPEAAVIHTGSKDLVFIASGEGGFSPRVVTLGAKAQGYFEVKSGITEGERISSGPNFLLDSESRIQFSNDSPL
jgi:multidrug efflux pump subunit AcrA (membrane-fusion protein)